MTAIITYYNQASRAIYLATDSTIVTPNGIEYGDKFQIIAERFVIAPRGPNILGETLRRLQVKQFVPQSGENLLDRIIQNYRWIRHVFINTPNLKLKNPANMQEAVVYDVQNHLLWQLTLGMPYNDQWEPRLMSYVRCDDRFDAIPDIPQADMECEADLLTEPQEFIEELLKEGARLYPNLEIQGLGSFLYRDPDNRLCLRSSNNSIQVLD